MMNEQLSDQISNAQKSVDDILNRYHQTAGNSGFPLDARVLVEAAQEYMGIKIELAERTVVSRHDDEGALIPVRGGFILQFGLRTREGKKDLFNPTARRRFTICHELAHALFYQCGEGVPKLAVNHVPEHVCHKLAREFLLPEALVDEHVRVQYNAKDHLIPFLRAFAKHADVGIYPLVKRLTEDLSLLNDRMITLWNYHGKEEQFGKIVPGYRDFIPDSKTSPELRRLLPKYWRERIHEEAWNAAVKTVATDGTSICRKSLYLEGKRKKDGKRKRISFDIECETLVELPQGQQALLKWTSLVPLYDLISSEKFDLLVLRNA